MLPNAVPVPELGWQRPPHDIVRREVMQRLEKPAIGSPLVAAPGEAEAKNRQRDRPILSLIRASMLRSELAKRASMR